MKLIRSIKKPMVAICCDRFFISVRLVANLEHCLVGTYCTNRVTTAKDLKNNLAKGESDFAANNYGTLAAK